MDEIELTALDFVEDGSIWNDKRRVKEALQIFVELPQYRAELADFVAEYLKRQGIPDSIELNPRDRRNAKYLDIDKAFDFWSDDERLELFSENGNVRITAGSKIEEAVTEIVDNYGLSRRRVEDDVRDYLYSWKQKHDKEHPETHSKDTPLSVGGLDKQNG